MYKGFLRIRLFSEDKEINICAVCNYTLFKSNKMLQQNKILNIITYLYDK